MKKPLDIVVNGVGYNCEYAVTLTEEQFVAKYMGRLYLRTPVPERERILRDVYKECVDKVNAATTLKEPEQQSEGTPVTPEAETTEELPKENKKGKGRTSPEKIDKGGT